METLRNIALAVIAVGGLGAFIDFLMGRIGQQRAKDFLLKWWVRFDDVCWSNFGREEGLFAGGVIEKWFAKKIWSLRRIVMAVIILSLSLLIGYFIFKTSPPSWHLISSPADRHIECNLCNAALSVKIAVFIVFFIGFSVSVSFTKAITFRIAYLCGMGKVRNLTIYAVMLIVNFLMLIYWSQLTGSVKNVVVEFVGDPPPLKDLLEDIGLIIEGSIFLGKSYIWFYFEGHMIDMFPLYALSYFPSVLRCLLSLIFVGSFLLRPLLMRPVSLVWARIVESDKPVFTVIFGGAAAFASAISEAAKHL
jgi:hypothetical protein